MFYQSDGAVQIPVYPVYPLLDCARRLFGMAGALRFPPMPGAHVVCANKSYTSDPAQGACWVWAAIALAIADDRNTQANLFIEDCGRAGLEYNGMRQIIAYLDGMLRAVTKSMVMCGVDQNVRYIKIYAGYVFEFVEANHVGCALTCAPYVLLAKNAVPPGGLPEKMVGMTISKWEQEVGVAALPELVRKGEAGRSAE